MARPKMAMRLCFFGKATILVGWLLLACVLCSHVHNSHDAHHHSHHGGSSHRILAASLDRNGHLHQDKVHSFDDNEIDSISPCAMEDVSSEQVARIGRLAQGWKKRRQRRAHGADIFQHSGSADTRLRGNAASQVDETDSFGIFRNDEDEKVTIRVCLHVILNSTEHGNLTDHMLQRQMDALNLAFSDASCCNATLDWCNPDMCSTEAGFRFQLDHTCTSRTLQQAWYEAVFESAQELDMKRTLRMGGVETLNVYFRNLPGGSGGRSWFPWWNLDQQDISQDGIMVNTLALAGGSLAPYDEGDVLVHEVGHWLGLYHTFQNGCSLSDGVVSTPPQATAGRGCEIGRDTCPDHDGLDPIHNFLDYSTDECKYEFTMEQIAIMHAAWEEYRSTSRPGRTVEKLDDGVPSQPITLIEEGLQRYVFDSNGADDVLCWASYIESTSNRPCSANCFNGNIDMFARWKKLPDKEQGIYDYSATGPGSFEVCTSTPPSLSSRLHIELLAKKSAVSVFVVCTQNTRRILQLENGIRSKAQTLLDDEYLAYSYALDSAGMTLTCSATGSSDGVQLYARLGAPVDMSRDWYDYAATSDGAIVLADLPKVAVYFSAVSTAPLSSVSVECTEHDPTLRLETGQTCDPLLLAQDDEAFFRFAVSDLPARSKVTCTTNGNSGDIMLSLRWDERPSRHEFELSVCSRLSYESNAPCTVTVPRHAQNLYLRLYAWDTAKDAISLTCSNCLRFLGRCTRGDECCHGQCRLGRCFGL